MKIIKYALLLSGLFFSFYSSSQVVTNYDPNDFKPARQLPEQKCYKIDNKDFCGDTWTEAYYEAAGYYIPKTTAQTSCGERCTYSYETINNGPAQWHYRVRQVVLSAQGTVIQESNFQNYWSPPNPFTLPSGKWKCPPQEKDAPPEQVALLSQYVIGAFQVDGQYRCYRPPSPLDCSGLKGLGASALYDSFIADAAAGYNKENPPSCLTKCAKDENGVEKCGDCKVAAASWSYQGSPTSTTQKWWANAGTFTGAACGEKESEEPPPEATKCWETTNGLSMCIQDPAEKCVTVSGVQQCEAGCGFINGAFYCAEKEPPKPNPNDKDKPLPEPDDNISNPEKPIGDMNKGDFKDVQRGVESRIVSVGVAVGNLENSVDGLGNTLDSMNDKLDKANGIGEAQLGYLKGIKDAVTDGDDGGEPDGNCDPLKDKKCDGNTGASGIKSWWNSKYPDGLGGLMTEKKEAFFESEAYKAITFEVTTGGGTLPIWNFCMNMGFADYGCKDLSLPSWLWGFIKSCMLFGAAILCRRLLIGA